MFDIGAAELFVIGVVALLVIGPERLPRVAKTLGLVFGRLQRYVAEVKSDINREIEFEDLRKLKATVQDAATSVQESITSQVNFIDSEIRQAGDAMQQQVESTVAPLGGIQLMSPAAADALPTETPPQDNLQQELPLAGGEMPGSVARAPTGISPANDKPV